MRIFESLIIIAFVLAWVLMLIRWLRGVIEREDR